MYLVHIKSASLCFMLFSKFPGTYPANKQWFIYFKITKQTSDYNLIK